MSATFQDLLTALFPWKSPPCDPGADAQCVLGVGKEGGGSRTTGQAPHETEESPIEKFLVKWLEDTSEAICSHPTDMEAKAQ